MKILKSKQFTYLTVIFLLYCLIDSDSGIPNNKRIQKNGRRRNLMAVIYTRNITQINPKNSTRRELCKWLRGFRHQKLMCIKTRGLAEILQQYKKLTLNACLFYFRYEQWPCLRQRKFFKKIYRETALMHSLSASAFMYLIGKACPLGKLENCECASHGKSDNNSSWQWGGCGDNTKFAKNLTYQFFQLRRKGDTNGDLNRHNSEIGIRVVMRNEEKACKCHGLSGSCTYKTCFKKIRPFEFIVKELINHYHNAIQLESGNNYNIRNKGTKKNLIYTESSPNFCATTTGRRCEDAVNCDTLCCGRGFTTSSMKVKETCNCRWRNETLYQLKCEQCERNEAVYTCQ